MIKAAVLGATGYAGIELVRLLTSHPEVSIEILGSHSFAGQKISDVYKNFNHVLEKECEELDLDKVGACDVVRFLYDIKNERAKELRKMKSADSRMLVTARKLLYGELAVALGKDYSEMSDLLDQYLGQN